MVFRPRVLVVDDEDSIRDSLSKILTHHGFEVEVAESAATALAKIDTTQFDVLLTDLRMAGPEDGLSVMRTMRISQPGATTLLMSASPNLSATADMHTLQADEIVAKPINIPALLKVIKGRLAGEMPASRVIESVAGVLDRSTASTVEAWLRRVEEEPRLVVPGLSRELRIGCVPRLVGELVLRLQCGGQIEMPPAVSRTAREHGVLRCRQGYAAAMLVHESRLLQLSLFQTLRNSLESLDFRVLLEGVMTIADGVDSQLSETMEAFVAEGRRVG